MAVFGRMVRKICDPTSGGSQREKYGIDAKRETTRFGPLRELGSCRLCYVAPRIDNIRNYTATLRIGGNCIVYMLANLSYDLARLRAVE